MRVAVGGSTGLIGTALASALEQRGDEVVRLVRRRPERAGEREWDPDRGQLASPGLTDVDAVVNLSGAGIADRRWDAERKRLLRSSRIQPTTTLVGALAESDRCRSFLSGSAVGFYGDGGDAELDESAPAGRGFLADLVQDWEDAARAATGTGTRTVMLRTGLVLAAEGGLLGRLKPIFRLGAGGRISDGRQYMPWISLRDHVAAMLFLLDSEAEGPVNLSAPHPVRNAQLTEDLGRALHRPTLVPVPTPGLRLLFGRELVTEALLVSQRAVPARLAELGFAHRDLDLAATLRDLV